MSAHVICVLLGALGTTAANAACQIDARPVAFGVVDVSNRNDGTGEIVLNCAVAASFEIGIAGDGSPSSRYMTGPGGSRLAYELYTDRTRATLWGDGGGGRQVTAASDGENETRLTVYGRVPSQDPVPPGAYSDALTVSVDFF
jgi:spore coat protein U-like protein